MTYAVHASAAGRGPLSTYRIVWCAPEEGEIDHLVVARDDEEARRISTDQFRLALGRRFKQWRLKDDRA